jgi:hypothetical protein
MKVISGIGEDQAAKIAEAKRDNGAPLGARGRAWISGEVLSIGV